MVCPQILGYSQVKGKTNSSSADHLEAVRLSNPSARYSCELAVPEKEGGGNCVSVSAVDILKYIFLLRETHTTSVIEIVSVEE